ncbi:MAG: PAS domain-containing protein [Rickettsiales bacterium]
MNDNRLTARLTSYWENLKKDDIVPDFKKNNPARIADLWEQCFVLSLLPNNFNYYKYEYIGDKIKKLYGEDVTGTMVNIGNSKFPNSVIMPKLQAIKSLSDMKSPTEDSGQMVQNSGKIIKYRSVLLPFGNEKSGLTHIIAGISHREF